MITFRRMIYVLIAIIALLSLTIVVLSINFKKAQLTVNERCQSFHSNILADC